MPGQEKSRSASHMSEYFLVRGLQEVYVHERNAGRIQEREIAPGDQFLLSESN